MDGRELGRFAADTGNECSVYMTVEKASRVVITFTWDRNPTADDQEAWQHTVLGEALSEALEYALTGRLIVETLRGLERDGKLQRTGVTSDGDWIFGPGPKPDDGRPPSRVVPLEPLRKRRQRHAGGEQRPGHRSVDN
jgi:hypothetical protein